MANLADSEVSAPEHETVKTTSPPPDKYRGVCSLHPIHQTIYTNHTSQATIEDLELPPALSVTSNDPISTALMAAYERDYTHLTVTSPMKRSLQGYLSIPRLKELLQSGTVKESDLVSAAMQRFNRKDRKYTTITTETSLHDLEKFFNGEFSEGEEQQFAVVTDGERKFVLGVVTNDDLKEFSKRRPSL